MSVLMFCDDASSRHSDSKDFNCSNISGRPTVYIYQDLTPEQALQSFVFRTNIDPLFSVIVSMSLRDVRVHFISQDN